MGQTARSQATFYPDTYYPDVRQAHHGYPTNRHTKSAMLTLTTISGQATSVNDFFVAPAEAQEQPTRHLYLRWSRSVKKECFLEKQITNVFAPFGEIEHIFINDNVKRIAVVCFKNIQDAQAASEALKGQKLNAIHQRVLHIDFALQKETTVDVSVYSLYPPVSLFTVNVGFLPVFKYPKCINNSERRSRKTRSWSSYFFGFYFTRRRTTVIR